MKNFEMILDEVLDTMGKDRCNLVLKYVGNTVCENMSCLSCRKEFKNWLLKEPEIDWAKVPVNDTENQKMS